MNREVTTRDSRLIPAIDIEVSETSVEDAALGKFHDPDNDGEARAQLARDADAAWGHGDGVGRTWEAPNPNETGWVPTINTGRSTNPSKSRLGCSASERTMRGVLHSCPRACRPRSTRCPNTARSCGM